jgi:hypothetical protein
MEANNKGQSVTSDVEKAAPAAVKGDDEEEDEYPPFAKVVFIMAALYLAMFLVALVRLSAVESQAPANQGRIEQF